MTTKPFFGSAEDDAALEEVNQAFWRSLLGHVRAEVDRSTVAAILDVGCHRGGLLELFAEHYRPRRVVGLEPLDPARQQARFRLSRLAEEVELLRPSEWPAVEAGSIDLVTCHEVLHLVEDLDAFMTELARVLRPGGAAYVVLGSHAENPQWARWKPQLLATGLEAFDHAPFDVLSAAARAGLRGALRPLRRDGWVIYDPLTAEYRYPSAEALFAHHYRHKLLFRLTRPEGSQR